MGLRDVAMSTSAEKQAAWVINPAASNNRDTGADAAHAIRDSEELTRRRWGRGTVFINQPTTIRYMAAVPAADALFYESVAIGPAGRLTIECDRTVALGPATLSAVTDFVSGSQCQEVVATGLGAQVGNQIEITNSATPAHIGAQAEIAADLGSGRVRTTPFFVPRTDGTVPTFGQTAAAIVRPDAGDTFTVYSRPAMAVGSMAFIPGSRVNSQLGLGFGYVLVKNMHLQGEDTYSASLNADVNYQIFNGCKLERLLIHINAARMQSCQVDTCFFERGSSLQKFTLFKDTFFQRTQFIRAHYADCHYIHAQGSYLPIADAGANFLFFSASAYDSADYGLTIRPASYVLCEGPIWGTGNGQFGVLIGHGAKLTAFSSQTRTLTGASGDISIRGIAGGADQTHAWTEGTFITPEGSGLILRP
jgi:hypothetical protein